MRTNHKCSKWILKLTDSTGRLACWRLQRSEFGFDIVLRVDVKHQTADARFRLQTATEDDVPLGEDLLLLASDTESDYTSVPATKTKSDDIILLNARKKTSIDAPPTLENLIIEQALEEYCKVASLNVGHTASQFRVTQRLRLVQKSLDGESIQILVQTSLRARNPY